MIEINWNPPARQLRQFAGIWLPLCGLVVGFWLWYYNWGLPWLLVLAAAVATVSAVGLWRPALIRPVYVGWMCAGFPIGWLVSHTALAVSYYLILTPIAIVMRGLGHDPLHRKRDPTASTYWVDRQERRDENRYFSQF